jgi:hypothetical protein
MTETSPEPALSFPSSLQPRTLSSIFKFGQVLTLPALTPSLGPLTAFTDTFTGHGFNTIFRPNLGSPTPLPVPPVGPNDNVLELNLTSETLTFSPPLGSVPNRGEVQPDIFLNGVPYLQAITDITNPAAPTGIHLEPGLWMSVPPTSVPDEGATLVRMASIPHGTTICAQGTSQTIAGPPTIDPVSITPAGVPPFPSQNAAANDTWRVPQQLPGTITQAMLDNPNVVLSDAIAGQTITSTTTISVATSPALPLFGGGTDNVAFLLGDPAAANPNAQTVEMTATFWVETVEHVIFIPPFTPGQPPLIFPAEIGDRPAPNFLVNPPVPIPRPIRIIVFSTQIQYSQTVMLNFNGLLWPHVSVATLVPSGPIPIPPPIWAAALRENPLEGGRD